jgi:SAM-dependent methyltransferase
MTMPALSALLGWIWRGKTLTRAMLNARLALEPALDGLTVDLGGGGIPTYMGLLDIRGRFVNMDRIHEARPTVVGNLETTFPFRDGCADTAILFNTLEHVYDFQHVVDEMQRILKPGGRALIYVPFIFPVHTHQTDAFLVDDFFRYSRSSLQRMLTRAGFSRIEIQPMGGLFPVLAEFTGFVLRWRLLRTPMFAFALVLEKIVDRLRPGVWAERYPLAYFISARK